MQRSLGVIMLFLVAALSAGGGCNAKDGGGPKELLDKFFSSAMQQDYATTYTCYYTPYRAKVSKDEFIKHRKEASVLQSYQITSLKLDGDSSAQAEVVLTFAPSERLKRTESATTMVKEELIKEGGDWKIKVW